MEIVINGRFTAQALTGVQRVAHEITRAIDRLLDTPPFRTWSVRLVMPASASLPYELRNVRIDKVPGGAGHRWEQVALPRHARGALLLCLGNSAPIVSLLRKSPTMVMLHDQAYRLFPGDYPRGYCISHDLVERLILSRASIILSVSEAERKVLLSTNTVRSRVLVAPNGSWMHDGQPRPPRSKSPAEGYGLYIGSFTERKNIKAVMATAIALARERQRHFKFVGPPNAMSFAAEAMVPDELRQYIHFNGYVADSALAQLYDGADFLIYPSFYEASGLPPSEAMHFGCPVIISDLPVMRERCGSAALYCDPSDHHAMVAAACRILDEPDLAGVMSRRGCAQAATFTWENQARTILEAATTVPAFRDVPAIRPLPSARRVPKARRGAVRQPASK